MGGICPFYGTGVFLDAKRGMYYSNAEGYLRLYKWVYFVMTRMQLSVLYLLSVQAMAAEVLIMHSHHLAYLFRRSQRK